uniref:Reverse transcriptase domain-containing protein n=1 Tax=Aegilops tauschii subsp. strangulata TaxID=200361 RepID=A0A452Y9K6_AEGTS
MQQLHPRRTIPTISLYADDVILLCHPSPGDITAVKEILHLFGRASSLHVNFQKSAAALIRCDRGCRPCRRAPGMPHRRIPANLPGHPAHAASPHRCPASTCRQQSRWEVTL